MSCAETALQICEHFFATLLIRIMEIYNDYYDQLPYFAWWLNIIDIVESILCMLFFLISSLDKK